MMTHPIGLTCSSLPSAPKRPAAAPEKNTAAIVAPNMCKASLPRLMAGWSIRSSVMLETIIEDLLDTKLEQARDAKGEGKRRIVLARLDRVHRLAGHVEFQGKIGLAPLSLGAQNSQSVVHVMLTCPYVRLC